MVVFTVLAIAGVFPKFKNRNVAFFFLLVITYILSKLEVSLQFCPPFLSVYVTYYSLG